MSIRSAVMAANVERASRANKNSSWRERGLRLSDGDTYNARDDGRGSDRGFRDEDGFQQQLDQLILLGRLGTR